MQGKGVFQVATDFIGTQRSHCQGCFPTEVFRLQYGCYFSDQSIRLQGAGIGSSHTVCQAPLMTVVFIPVAPGIIQAVMIKDERSHLHGNYSEKCNNFLFLCELFAGSSFVSSVVVGPLSVGVAHR
jgi:hypothetical protein